MLRFIISAFLISIAAFSFSQQTYSVNGTEYIIGEYYATTGKPKVKRSSKAKKEFLSKYGLKKSPKGYVIDHIVPLSQGGSDNPYNMQLLTIEQHKRKTAREKSTLRFNISRYTQSDNYNSSRRCGALTSKGTYCKRKVKGTGYCHSHK